MRFGDFQFRFRQIEYRSALNDLRFTRCERTATACALFWPVHFSLVGMVLPAAASFPYVLVVRLCHVLVVWVNRVEPFFFGRRHYLVEGGCWYCPSPNDVVVPRPRLSDAGSPLKVVSRSFLGLLCRLASFPFFQSNIFLWMGSSWHELGRSLRIFYKYVHFYIRLLSTDAVVLVADFGAHLIESFRRLIHGLTGCGAGVK